VDAIDVRTDVYSLGVLLYQLVTSEFPYRMDGSLPELLAQIVEAPPTPPRRHVPDLPPDLETIILKCLQKEPLRRYQSAGELGRDLQRFLAREPIEARRDSYAYVLARQLARYKLAAIGSACFLVVLLGGLAASLTLWRQAVVARASAETEKHNAQVQAGLARAANDFLNDMLRYADRSAQGGNADVKVREALDQAARMLDADGATQTPEVREALLATVGRTYQSLGLYAEAERHLRELVQSLRTRLGAEHAEVAGGLLLLASVLRDRGEFVEFEQLARAAAEIRKARLGARHPLVAAALNDVGTARQSQHDLEGAEELYRQTLELWEVRTPDDADALAQVKVNLALVRQSRGDHAEAERLYGEALALLRDVHGPEHPRVAAALNNLAALLDLKGDLDGAEQNFRAALEMRRKLFGEEHALVAQSLNNLAGFLQMRRRDLAAAETLYRQALALRERLLQPDHPDIPATRGNLASLLQDRGQLDEAGALYEQVIEAIRANRGAQDVALGGPLGNLASLRSAQGRLAEAERLLSESVAIWRALGDARHPSLAIQLTSLGVVQAQQCNFDAAEANLREALAIRESLVGPEHPETARSLGNLGALLTSRGAFAEAEPVLREALRQLSAQPGAEGHVAAFQTYLGWAVSELAWEGGAEPAALTLATEGEQLLRATLPPGQPTTEPSPAAARMQSLLGGAIVAAEHAALSAAVEALDRGQLDARLCEAEALLQAAVESLSAVAPTKLSPARRRLLADTAERLARLSETRAAAGGEVESLESAATWRERAEILRANAAAP
jgi:tetratricopeptide (TPR) repeat protein